VAVPARLLPPLTPLLAHSSRLGTEIVLSKDLDGLVVAVPEAPPVEEFVYEHEYDEDDFEEHP
jgi:hypothetical protein